MYEEPTLSKKAKKLSYGLGVYTCDLSRASTVSVHP
jgi:hypothetical protein